ncbi:tRNA (adenosine(37)-N6)-threonylcarbamoyltransferase complex transferase subunit TsaD [Pelagibacteraceae bacterium]|nr:tRNA (adenosine(37)-N6)-threonylcarbamoyltransferase complex transferase subunit TsaD [Pelagibacteraceae bacterium]
MIKNRLVLGIESSCDETSVSIVKETSSHNQKILSNVVNSQIKIHEKSGGVIPEMAARSHSMVIDKLIESALKKAKIQLHEIDAVAATAGPGLLGGLIVGVVAAKTLASVINKPFIAINHLEGHALSAKLEHKIEYPYLLLLVSGGHTEYTIINNFNNYTRIGTTLDDALGEAFDKSARVLGFKYPGGPEIENYAKDGNENKYRFPKPIIDQANCHFSFSGLKTAVAQKVAAKKNPDKKFKNDIAASFQKTICDILETKTKYAISEFKKSYPNKKISIVVAGGVAANQKIKEVFNKIGKENSYDIFFPSLYLCTDNAAMIAYAGLERLKRKKINSLEFKPKPRWPLDPNAIFLKGKRINE